MMSLIPIRRPHVAVVRHLLDGDRSAPVTSSAVLPFTMIRRQNAPSATTKCVNAAKRSCILLEPIPKVIGGVHRLKMSDDSADKRAVGAHRDSFPGRAHPRWTSWTQADPDPTCFRSCIVDTQHWRAVAHAAAKLSELQIRSSALSNL